VAVEHVTSPRRTRRRVLSGDGEIGRQRAMLGFMNGCEHNDDSRGKREQRFFSSKWVRPSG
jgi:hypothetical protein